MSAAGLCKKYQQRPSNALKGADNCAADLKVRVTSIVSGRPSFEDRETSG